MTSPTRCRCLLFLTSVALLLPVGCGSGNSSVPPPPPPNVVVSLSAAAPQVEAGGTVTDMHGGPLSLRVKHILADNTLIHAETIGLFAEIFAGHYRTPLPEMREES